jgi:MoxR-like ATPase
MQIDVNYPSLAAERQILFETTGASEKRASEVMTAKRLQELQGLVRRIPAGESVVDAILELVRSSRPGGVKDDLDAFIDWGPGPRASQALMLTVRARAMLQGRLAPSVDDVMALAEPVLQHRMQLSFAARAAEERVNVRDVIAARMKRIG